MPSMWLPIQCDDPDIPAPISPASSVLVAGNHHNLGGRGKVLAHQGGAQARHHLQERLAHV